MKFNILSSKNSAAYNNKIMRSILHSRTLILNSIKIFVEHMCLPQKTIISKERKRGVHRKNTYYLIAMVNNYYL